MREQFDILGFSFDDRGPRTTEGIELLRHFWTADEVDFHSSHYDLHGFKMYPKPVRPEGIPIWCGGYSKASINRVAAVGDGWHPLALDPAGYRDHLSELAAALERRGRTLADVTLTARPLNKVPYTAETLEEYAALGVSHFVCDTSFEHPTLQAAMDEIENLAGTLLPVAHRLGEA
jgi:alkanesulfonate monooxygenase SsuD/methylene tetrahydromethanopterin reductase-like flavin-dependent oxidoreductase (luciferase family)